MGERVVVRADGSHRMGFGHLSRMLTLAEGLRAAGYAPCFVTRAADPAMLGRIEGAGLAFEQLPPDAGWALDIAQTSASIARLAAPVVVTDLSSDEAVGQPRAYGEYLAGLKATGALLVAFDDFKRLPFAPDVLVNSNVGAEAQYDGTMAGTCLLGPRYFPLSQRLAEVGRRRRVREPARRIMVTMGSGDHLGLTPKVVEALRHVRASEPLEVVVFPHLQADRAKEAGSLAPGFPGRLEVVEPLSDLVDYLEWADVAVTAAGVTKYETAAAGVPSVILAQVPHQDPLAGQFAVHGSARYLGMGDAVPVVEIAAAVEAILGDEPRRRAMTEAGRRLVDGRGVERIVDEIRQRAETERRRAR